MYIWGCAILGGGCPYSGGAAKKNNHPIFQNGIQYSTISWEIQSWGIFLVWSVGRRTTTTDDDDGRTDDARTMDDDGRRTRTTTLIFTANHFRRHHPFSPPSFYRFRRQSCSPPGKGSKTHLPKHKTLIRQNIKPLFAVTDLCV